MARKEKKYHFIYKTIDTRNNNFYIGMHSTDNLNDGYLGSGKRIRNLKYLYGKNILKLEILEYLPNKNELRKREAEIVNYELINNKKCMNLREGGEGGFNKKISIKGNKKKNWLLENDLEWSKNYKKRVSDGLKKAYKNGNKKVCKSFKDKKHTEDAKNKISLANKNKGKGDKNSQFNTMWITNGKINKKIKKGEEIPFNWYKGRFFNK